MEKRDLYDINRNLTGETIFKDEKTPKDRYILVVLVFIQNSKGDFLIQKRRNVRKSSQRNAKDSNRHRSLQLTRTISSTISTDVLMT